MNVRPFFDTNVLLYAFGDGDLRNQTARELLGDGGVTGVQVLNEFVAIARRKLGFSWEEVSEALASIRVLFPSTRRSPLREDASTCVFSCSVAARPATA